MVKSIPLCLITQPDELIWPHSANGVYTVKSGYRFLQTEFQNQQPGQSNPLMLKPLWKGIWSLKVPSKVKNLVWRAVKNSLPTKQNLVKRKAIWKRRNDIRVGKRGESLPNLVQQAQTRLQNFLLHNSAATTSTGQPPTQWQPPAHQQYKINFDGALFKDENQAGLGVVIRDSKGQVMVSLAQRIPLPSTAIEVEALAARRALELALETGLNKGVLEGDSLILMNALKSNSHSLAQFGHIVNDIHYLAFQFPMISFSHVRRHCNSVAHSIARRALSFSSLQVWMEDVPPEIADVLQTDLIALVE
nr:uncharacterized protein LOC112009346 [Quercus suber]